MLAWPLVRGALFRFAPFFVSNSSSGTSALDSTSATTSGTSILTRGRQTVVIPIREVGAPLEVRSSEKNISETSSHLDSRRRARRDDPARARRSRRTRHACNTAVRENDTYSARMSAFEEMGVCPELIRSADEAGWLLPTPVQAEAVPLILGGGDVLAAAETGSGKTGAFGMPVLQIVHEALRDAAATHARGKDTRADGPDGGSCSGADAGASAVRVSVDDRTSLFAVDNAHHSLPNGRRAGTGALARAVGGRARHRRRRPGRPSLRSRRPRRRARAMRLEHHRGVTGRTRHRFTRLWVRWHR